MKTLHFHLAVGYSIGNMLICFAADSWETQCTMSLTKQVEV